MNSKYILLSISVLLVFLTIPLKAQEKDSKTSPIELKEHGKRFKDCRVLVKLNSNMRKLDILRKNGQTKIANRLAKDLDEEQNKIMKAFYEVFMIKDVYFFYSHESKDVLIDKNFGVLFNKEGQARTIKYTDKPTYVVTFENPPFMPSVSDYWFGLFSLELDGLKTLEYPFLNWVRTSSLLKRRNYSLGVKRLNKRISDTVFLSEKKI